MNAMTTRLRSSRKGMTMNARFILAGLLAALFALPAAATTVVPLTTKDLAKKADIICTGTCVRSKSYLDVSPSDGVRINTNYLINVEETVKGEEQHVVVITEWGGQIGQTLQWIAGSPHYETGEKVLVFLKKTENETVTIGMSQGKYEIFKEVGTGKDMVRRDLSGLEFIDAKKKTYLDKPKDPGKMYLADFLDEIRRYVGRNKGR